MPDLFAYLEGFGTGESFTKSVIIVTDLPTGSTVTATKGETVKTADEKNGEWWINGLDLGEWKLKATLGEQSATTIYNIEKFGVHYVPMSFQLYPDDFDWSEMGTKGVDYEIVQDDDTPIPVEDYRKYKNWKARVLTSGFVTALKDGYIDVFAVGAGAGGGFGKDHCGGGAGGETDTLTTVQITKGTRYAIVIGAGGPVNKSGGNTSGFGLEVSGGNPGTSANTVAGAKGGDGQTGGGGASYSATGGAGGSDGSDGSNGNNGSSTLSNKGKGTGKTTGEFGDSSARKYAPGGGGSSYNQSGGPGGEPGGGDGSSNRGNATPGEDNTGAGGGGGENGNGGSGILIIRNAREVA